VAVVGVERRVRAPAEATILRVHLAGIGGPPLMVGPHAHI